MLKQLKPGRYYIIVNLDEPYAEDVFEVLKYGQQQKGEWPEGDVDFVSWVKQTWEGNTGYNGAVKAATGALPWEQAEEKDRSRYSLLAAANARAEKLAAEGAVLRKALERTTQHLRFYFFKDRNEADLDPLNEGELALQVSPLTAAYVERVKAMEEVIEVARDIRAELVNHLTLRDDYGLDLVRDFDAALARLDAIGKGEATCHAT